MKKKNYLEMGYIMNLIFCILILTSSLFFMTTGYSQYITKSLASILFVVCGGFNFVFCKKFGKSIDLTFSVLMLTGLFFAMLGDILLIDFFIIGALLFAIGHVFYFVAFVLFQNPV